jgi:hypothetical protein
LALVNNVTAGNDRRKLFRTYDTEIGPGRVYASYGFTQVIVIRQRFVNELLELFVFEELEPLQVCE